jgi:futalosine hydrolase
MNLLIVSATEAEIAPFTEYMQTANLRDGVSGGILYTGVGMLNTAYEVTKMLQMARYDLVLQVGVAGSYGRNIDPGQVVFVTSDQYGDLGAEDHDNYIDIFEMGLINKDARPYVIGKLYTPLIAVHNKITLKQVSGLTVNTVSGNERTIKMRNDKYHCDVETMEGAALHYVCLKEKAPFAQIRAISNYVIPRDKNEWKMKEAIINLNNWLIDFVKSL